MNKEASPISQLVTALVEAARREDWKTVDEQLVPQLKMVNGNKMAKAMLPYAADENPNVRDVVATALAPLDISAVTTRASVISEMKKMAVGDPERFPAGRAAVVLLKYRGDEGAEEAIARFTQRAYDCEWATELIENIPKLKEILTIKQPEFILEQ